MIIIIYLFVIKLTGLWLASPCRTCGSVAGSSRTRFRSCAEGNAGITTTTTAASKGKQTFCQHGCIDPPPSLSPSLPLERVACICLQSPISNLQFYHTRLVNYVEPNAGRFIQQTPSGHTAVAAARPLPCLTRQTTRSFCKTVRTRIRSCSCVENMTKPRSQKSSTTE